MHSGITPRLLPRDQVAFAINTTFRNGLPRTRPVWRKLSLSFTNDDTKTAATTKLFQEGMFYQAYGQGENCLVSMVGGRLFRYLVGIGQTAKVGELTWTGQINDPVNPDAWMWQAENFLIVNNGAADPLFFDGASVRRSLGLGGNELPAGCMGVYVQGRNWFALPSQQKPSQAFMAGDLVYSHGFDDGYDGRSSCLKTEENTLFSGGGAFSVPLSAGPITAMSSVAIADTSLGQGPLQVLTRGSVFSVQVPLDRTQWANTQYPLMTIGLPNYGALSQWGVVTVNGDLWYRAVDGIRSYQIARRDFNTWVNTPMSVEMDRVLQLDTEQFLSKCSGVVFNNRLLLTCSPYVVRGRGTAHRGLVALDFNNISNLTSRAQPAYDGLWTGVGRLLKIIKGVFNGHERCFAFALGCDGAIGLWELVKDESGYFDWDGTATVGVESSIETRSMGWGDGGNALKRLLTADLYLDRVAGNDTVNVGFKYRSDEAPLWTDWHNFQLCAPISDCTTGACPTFDQVHEQYRTYLRLPDPADTPCNPITLRSPRTGYEFQLRLAFKGFFQLNRLHTWAQAIGDSVIRSCPTTEACRVVKGCDEPWFRYDIENCGGLPPEPPGPPEPPPPGPPPPGLVGIIEEDLQTWIREEGDQPILRTEDQPQIGPSGPTPPPPPVPPTPPPNTPPVFPVPAPFACAGQQYDLSPLQVTDALVSPPYAAYVGIPPVADPSAYVAANGAAGCLQAWSDAVWADFVSRGIPYSQARLVWYLLPTSGLGFFGTQVFPNQLGGYAKVLDLDWKIVTEWCP